MTPALTTGLVVAALVVAVWAVVQTVLGRRVSGPQLLVTAVVEVVLMVAAVVGVVRLGQADGVDSITFIGYWLTAVLLLPVGAFWAIGERSRWGNGVLALAGAVVAVLVLRLEQIWSAGG